MTFYCPTAGLRPMWVALDIVCDLVICFAYLGIPLCLVAFVRQSKPQVALIYYMFAAFIVSCGLTHAAQCLGFLGAPFAVEVGLDAVCAVLSLCTLGALIAIRKPLRDFLERATRAKE